jgi:excinuclease ABC subunit B
VIDAAFRSRPGVCDAEGTQVTLPAEPLEVLSFDPVTCASAWKPVTAVSRHRPPAMFRVRTGCGREVVVTGDHNFLRLRDGTIELAETTDLGEGDFLPLPLGIPGPAAGVDAIDLFDLFADSDSVVVVASEAFAWLIEQAGWEAVRAVLKRWYPEPSNKRWVTLVRKSDPSFPLACFRALLDELGVAPPEELPIRVRWAKRGYRRSLPRWLPVSDDLLTVLGLMLAEGHCQQGYSIFACYDPEVRRAFFDAAARLGIPTAVRPSSDVQISSALWTELFRQLVGAKSRDKHLPDFWPDLSDAQLAVFLRAYFEGDGGVERPQVCVTTASRRLASDLGYALTRLGFWPRLRRRWKRATNSAHAGAWYHSIALSGRDEIARFAAGIGFLSQAKNERVQQLLAASSTANTNVDVIPVGGANVRRLREAAALSKAQMARTCGRTRGMIQLLEKHARHPSRTSFTQLLASVRAGGSSGMEHDPTFQSATHLLNARWTPVVSVEPVEYDRPHVYDFSVADNETFLAGHGGLFVHNTFTCSHLIAQLGKPTLVLAHNKTLAAQLFKEFKGFFPHNAVHYFVSYYDYYQPEAYIPQRDIYIEKDALINENIDRLRLAATSALVSREDVIIVASVSCIYGLGSPSDYKRMMIHLPKGGTIAREDLLLRLVDIQYERNDYDFARGKFRVRGDVVEVWPAYEEIGFRIELFGDEIEALAVINATSGETIKEADELYIYPAKHFVTPDETIRTAVEGIRGELEERLAQLNREGKLLEAQRLAARTNFDMEMLLEVGHCPGIENYARWFSGRKAGEPPYTLLDFFPDDFLMVVDESHVTLPQVRGMFAGDHSRKLTLVEHGFRLPSALDNRPLRFDEWQKRVKQVLFMSATPSDYELERSGGEVVEQVIRPTGLVDPVLHVRPARGQVPDLVEEIKKRAERRERVLVTTLTKRLAEDLSTYFRDAGLKGKWLHSELDAIERVQILRELREGAFDVLVGVNLLREGLDLPEVSLVAILDADKQGFLRSETSLIQTIGRAARNVNAEVILYADKVTDAMQRAIEETSRRRELQLAYNAEHGITPETVRSAISTGIEEEIEAHRYAQEAAGQSADDYVTQEYLEELHAEMIQAAQNLEFERAAQLRDRISKLKGEPVASPQAKKARRRKRSQ